jgi:hypothetical protein
VVSLELAVVSGAVAGAEDVWQGQVLTVVNLASAHPGHKTSNWSISMLLRGNGGNLDSSVRGWFREITTFESWSVSWKVYLVLMDLNVCAEVGGYLTKGVAG